MVEGADAINTCIEGMKSGYIKFILSLIYKVGMTATIFPSDHTHGDESDMGHRNVFKMFFARRL